MSFCFRERLTLHIVLKSELVIHSIVIRHAVLNRPLHHFFAPLLKAISEYQCAFGCMRSLNTVLDGKVEVPPKELTRVPNSKIGGGLELCRWRHQLHGEMRTEGRGNYSWVCVSNLGK